MSVGSRSLVHLIVMKLENKVAVEALRALPIFSTLSDEKLAEVADVAVLRRVPRHALVVGAGDSNNSLYLILSGGLKVVKGDDEGHEVILSMLGPGESFGEMGIIDGLQGAFTVQATSVCSLAVIAAAEFRRCMADNVGVAFFVMRSLVRRLRVANRKIESLSLFDVYDRVDRVLLDLAEDREGRKVVSRRITRQDISQMVGASREMVSRVMRDLQMRGVIEEKGGLIWLCRELDSAHQ